MTTRGTLASLGLALMLPVFATTSLADITDMKQGKGGSDVQGAAGTSGSSGDVGLEKCSKPMGAIAVVEPQDAVTAALSQYNLGSPTGLIRLMIQQSNCFLVVERGQGMQNMMQERELMSSGQLRGRSNIGGGQMVVADFIMTPAVVFSDQNAGGVGGALGGVIGGFGGAVLAGVAGGLKFKEAQTSMLVADARSGIQVAAAEGSAKKADLSLGVGLLGGVGAGVGGYGSTAEGKVIAASLMNNYNQIVTVIRNDPNLQRDVGSLASEAAAGGSTKAGAVFTEGDVLFPKVNNLRLLSSASDGSKVVATLSKEDELVYMGEEKSGYIKVEAGAGGGWVKKLLVTQ